tara:strand:- start:263 stop:481 length:219 start_codon:yes stop_codon:yes gene_type:complete
MAINIDKYITNLNGMRKGDATSIAIISLPEGSAFRSGIDNTLYTSPENGINMIKTINTNNSIFDSLFLNSNK